MTAFGGSREVAAPADRVWAALVDWPAHARWVPFTRIRVLTERPDGVGARFVAWTGLGPVGFDDPMEVTAWEPPRPASPGRAEVVKHGRVLLGRARIDVEPLAGGRSRARWSEDVELAPLWLTRRIAPVLSPVVARTGSAFARHVLRRMAREVERGSAAGQGRGPGPGTAGR